MQRLGRALNVTPSQSIVVKIDKTPPIGSTVINDKLKVVGKVFDIIGPVSSPYAVVKTTIKDPSKLISKQLYRLLSKKERGKKA